jgi:hypothetical protein
LTRLGIAAVVLGLCSVFGAPAASAHPEITYLSCESGGSTYLCDLEYAYAQEPVTIRWYLNGLYVSNFDNQTYVHGSCSVNSGYSVTAVVSDIAGSSQASTYFICRRVWQ